MEDGRCYIKSDAAIMLSKELRGVWPVFAAPLLIPKPVRDMAYDLVARNLRYFFGKGGTCPVSSENDLE